MVMPAGGAPSYSDTSSASASLTQGTKNSGLTIASPTSTSDVFNALLKARDGGGSSFLSGLDLPDSPYVPLLAVSVVALLVALYLGRRK